MGLVEQLAPVHSDYGEDPPLTTSLEEHNVAEDYKMNDGTIGSAPDY